MKAIINPAIADKFELVGEHRDHVETSYGSIRFSKLTEKFAEELIRQGCPFIRRKPVKVAEPEQVKDKGIHEAADYFVANYMAEGSAAKALSESIVVEAIKEEVVSTPRKKNIRKSATDESQTGL
jgi:hypothetical protein